MRPLHPVAKTIAVFAGLVILYIGFLVWEFGFSHHLATLRLGEHQLRLTVRYQLDVADDVWCELSGPKQKHSKQIMAFIGAGESWPGFTVHQSPTFQVYWVTADTLPKTILYALDVETGEHWPPRESGGDGQKFLEIANAAESGYRLYEYEWIGVKK